MIEFVIKDRDNPEFRPKNPKGFPTRVVRRKGQVFDINGEKLELFPIGVLAEAMDRSNKCILRWEKDKLFPKPLFKVPGKGEKKRWYSAMQITNCHRIAWHRHKFSKGRHFNPRTFCSEVRSVFYVNRLVVNTKGQIITQSK